MTDGVRIFTDLGLGEGNRYVSLRVGVLRVVLTILVVGLHPHLHGSKCDFPTASYHCRQDTRSTNCLPVDYHWLWYNHFGVYPSRYDVVSS